LSSTHEELNARLEQLERDFRDFSSEVSASMRTRGPEGSALHRISLTAWLQISGPTFATLVFGFTLLWNAQQVQTGSMLEVQRSIGRLEGSITGLDARIEGLDARMQGLDSRMQGLDTRLERLDARVGSLEGSINRLDARIDKLGNAVDALAERLGSS
jgi:outer membrane murein-binding lipoprotein Lpp